MRAAAILGLGSPARHLNPFQTDKAVEWRVGMPSSPGQADAILLFGGDGTIHRHLAQLVQLGLPVLIVAAGSGNDFARALGLPRVRDSSAAWRRFCQGTNNVRMIDLGMITPLQNAGGVVGSHELARESAPGTRYFCCAAGVGLDGQVSRRASELPRWLRGHGGYALSLAPALFGFAPLPVRIQTVDNPGPTDTAPNPNATSDSRWRTRSDRPTILAAFANTPTYGGGMKIAPQAVMDDGQLDACVIAGIAPLKLFCLFPTVYFGGHLNIRGVKYFQANRFRVETETPFDVYADGEYVCRTPVEIGVAPKALHVIANP